jgi:hypothetical protein
MTNSSSPTPPKPENGENKGANKYLPIIVFSISGLLLLITLVVVLYHKFYATDIAIDKVRSAHFSSSEMTEAKNLNGLEVVAALNPKEKLALLDGLTQIKAGELVLKLGESDINAVAIFKTENPLLYLAYGTNCAGHYKYTLMTPARASSPELLLKPAVVSSVLEEDRKANKFIPLMPIMFTNELYESRASYIFHDGGSMHPVKEGSEEELLDISLCLEGGKKDMPSNTIDEDAITQKTSMFSDEIEQ